MRFNEIPLGSKIYKKVGSAFIGFYTKVTPIVTIDSDGSCFIANAVVEYDNGEIGFYAIGERHDWLIWNGEDEVW